MLVNTHFHACAGALPFYSLSINSFRPELHLIRTVNNYYPILPRTSISSADSDGDELSMYVSSNHEPM